MNQHPELYKPPPKRRKPKGEREIIKEAQQTQAKEERYRRKEGAPQIIDNTKRRPRLTND